MRDRPALSACATRPGHAVNMLLDERRSARDTLAQHRCNSTALRACSLSQSLSAHKSCATLAPSPPYSRQVMPGHV